ncbi:MAG TPA: FHA domain-containing protein [Candidatus Binatia bacterium]|nr:FHA domain-containing protein [Candidatus Binatia bacterium]
MAALGYVEILDGRGGVVERMRVESFPLKIGRAYHNDIILDDPYVCPTHAVIAPDEEGRLVVRDLDSVNGLRADAHEKPVTHLGIKSGSQFRIGHTQLRYREVNHDLAPTLVDRDSRRLWLNSPYTAVIAAVAVFLLLCLDAYLTIIERLTFAAIVNEPLTTFGMLLFWSGLWALASRVVVSRFHFSQHATIACGAVAGFFLLSFLSEWTEFLFPVVPVLWIAGLFGSGLIMAALVYGHLKFASNLRRSSRFWAALAVTATIVGVSAIADYAGRSKFSNTMEFTGILKPLDAAWLPTINIDDFVERSEKMKQELDTLAQKAKAAQR